MTIIGSMQIIDINGETRECLEISPDQSFPGYIKVLYASKYRPNHKYSEWYKKEDFIKNNPNLVKLIKGTPQPWKEDLGRVSMASNQTITDKTKKWKSNEFAGYPLWISRGLGEGQMRKIIINSNDTLIIDKPWKITPDKSSQYVISHNVHDPQVMGNTMPTEIKTSKKLARQRHPERSRGIKKHKIN